MRTVPGVGPITALTWALEIGDFTRFRSIKEAISYCGLCGDENSSADKVMRMPLSKQRNKHIQRVLVEAAKLAPRECHELAVVREQSWREEIPTGPRWPWPGKWSAIYWRWSAASGTSCLPSSSLAPQQPKNLPKKGKNIEIFPCADCQVLQVGD